LNVFRTCLVSTVARLEAGDIATIDEERRRTSCFDVSREALVDAANHRRERHDNEHADRDTHDREECPHFIRAHRFDGE
jgi:hypothetical protein